MKRSISSCFLVLAVVLAPAWSAVGQESAIPLGTPMPGQGIEVSLAKGGKTTLAAQRGKVLTAVVFWGNKCPWTTRYEDRIKLLGKDFVDSDKVLILVNSNDAAAFPAESAQESSKYAADRGLTFPYVIDSTSKLAAAFGATRTPQVFVFDAAGTLVYSGAIDDSPGDPDNVSKGYLRDAFAAVSASQPVPVPETKAFGCMIRPVR